MRINNDILLDDITSIDEIIYITVWRKLAGKQLIIMDWKYKWVFHTSLKLFNCVYPWS